MNEQEEQMVSYYATLSYTKQRKLLVALMAENRKPPYYIAFKLDTTGLNHLAKVTTYCKKHSIPYKAEKVGETKVRYRFEGMSERNTVLIGQLTV